MPDPMPMTLLSSPLVMVAALAGSQVSGRLPSHQAGRMRAVVAQRMHRNRPDGWPYNGRGDAVASPGREPPVLGIVLALIILWVVLGVVGFAVKGLFWL